MRGWPLALLLLAAPGCSGGGGGGATPAEAGIAPPVAPADPEGEAIHRAWAKARTDVAAVDAVIRNAGSYEADLKKYERIWEGLKIATRIPEQAEPEPLRAALAAHAKRHQLTLSRFTAPILDSPELPPPSTVRPDEEYPVKAGQALWRLGVSFTLSPLSKPDDLVRIERFVATLAEAGPLLVVREVKAGKGSATVEAEAFVFRTFDPVPRYVRPPPDPAAELQAAGVARLLAELRAGPRAGEVKELEESFATLAARQEEVNRSFELLSRAMLQGARYRAFEEQARRAEQVRFADVLR